MNQLETPDYAAPTVLNLLDSDATLILYRRTLDGGTRLTLNECEKRGRPFLALDAGEACLDDSVAKIVAFLGKNTVSKR